MLPPCCPSILFVPLLLRTRDVSDVDPDLFFFFFFFFLSLLVHFSVMSRRSFSRGRGSSASRYSSPVRGRDVDFRVSGVTRHARQYCPSYFTFLGIGDLLLISLPFMLISVISPSLAVLLLFVS
jgi:hypothetical protein